MKFTEKEIRQGQCYGSADPRILVYPGGYSVYADGVISHVAPEEGRSAAALLTPDEAVRLLRERGVIEDEPVAQPDKWSHLPEGGEWVHCPSAACIYHVTDLTFEAFELCGLTGGVVQVDRFRLVTGDTTMTRAEAIAIFEANASPDHIVDANKMVTDEAHYIQEACDWREANRVAEARIADLERQLAATKSSESALRLWFENSSKANDALTLSIAVHKQQFIDATAMAVYARECLNESSVSHARTGDELYDARRDIIALRGKVATTNKEISDLGKRYDGLRSKLNATAESEAVMADELAKAEAAVADLMEQVEERDANITTLEQQLADARSSEGVTGARLATAEATIADLRRQLAKSEDIYDELMCLAKKKDRTIADLRISHARYEFVRTLTPMHFDILWQRCLRGDKFDAVVDDIILERAKAVKNDAR